MRYVYTNSTAAAIIQKYIYVKGTKKKKMNKKYERKYE